MISDLLGHTVNEGFENSPLYRANPEFWNTLKGSSHYSDIEKGQAPNHRPAFQVEYDIVLYKIRGLFGTAMYLGTQLAKRNQVNTMALHMTDSDDDDG